MKKLLKITSIALSAIMLTSAVTSVPVFAVSQNDDFDGIVIDDGYVDKSGLEGAIRYDSYYSYTGGGCFEKESYERYSQAYFNALNILDSDTATQEEVDAAAKELYEALDSLTPAEFDLSKADHYYYLGKDIIENHKDEYPEEKFNKFKDAFFELQVFLSCSIKTSQEEIDVEVEKFEAALVELETNYVDKSGLKSVIRMSDFDGGGCFEKESYERYSQALENAYNILYSDTATQEDVDAAAKELQEASNGLIPAEFDLSKANHYYYLGKEIIENHKDEYPEEKFNKFKDAFFDLQAFLSCSTKTSQEEIDVEVEKFEAALVELVGDLSDCKAYLLAYDYIYGYPIVPIEAYVGMPICTVSDYRIVPAYYNLAIDALIDERINGYIFHGYYQHTPACYGYIAVNVETGEIIALENALRNNIIDIDEFFECYRRNGVTSSEPFTMYLIGDCDNDGLLTVKDATELQRSLVNDKNLNNDGAFRENPNDVNNDHAVNILDVTEIQKIIVNS